MHLTITGTRKGMTEAQFETLRKMIYENRRVHKLHQGDAIGVDAEFVYMTMELRPDIWIITHPPINKTYRAYSPCDEIRPEAEYLRRNRDMVDESTLVWGVPKGDEILRSGTWACIRYAWKTNTPIQIIKPDGILI